MSADMSGPEITETKPNIIIGEHHQGWIHLSAWEGFQSRKGSYGAIDSPEGSDGIVNVMINGVSVDYVHVLSKAQFNSIKYLKENSDIVRDSLLDSLLKDYSNAKEIYEDELPEIEDISEYRNHLGIANIHVMESERDDFAYIGFELGCTWDDEHGVGFMMHKDRVVNIGLADESFNEWSCFHDNGTSEIEQLKWEQAHAKMNKNRKKWWQFWK